MSVLPGGLHSLSVQEKFDLLDAIWEDLEAGASALSAEQSAELDRRMAAYEQNRSSVIPWEQVKATLFRR